MCSEWNHCLRHISNKSNMMIFPKKRHYSTIWIYSFSMYTQLRVLLLEEVRGVLTLSIIGHRDDQVQWCYCHLCAGGARVSASLSKPMAFGTSSHSRRKAVLALTGSCSANYMTNRLFHPKSQMKWMARAAFLVHLRWRHYLLHSVFLFLLDFCIHKNKSENCRIMSNWDIYVGAYRLFYITIFPLKTLIKF